MLLGSLGYWALVLLVASSVPVVRRLAHGLFKVSTQQSRCDMKLTRQICHIVGIIGFLAGTAMHAPPCLPYW